MYCLTVHLLCAAQRPCINCSTPATLAPKVGQCRREAAAIRFQRIMMAPRSPGPFCVFRFPLPCRSNTGGSAFELDDNGLGPAVRAENRVLCMKAKAAIDA
jgi:hypothetical protein